MPAVTQPIPLHPATTTDTVYWALYQAIITLGLPPGTKVSEAEIAKTYDVSRQPVRDAFYRLSEIGFMLIRPQRATTITYISERALQNVRFVRTALEVECLRTAIGQITDAQIDGLESLLQQQAERIAAGDKLGFHELDDQFHRVICEIAGHPHAWNLIRDQKAHLDRVRYLSLSFGAQSAFDDHRDVLDAIIARDTPQAERCLRRHLSTIDQILAQVRVSHAAYFSDA